MLIYIFVLIMNVKKFWNICGNTVNKMKNDKLNNFYNDFVSNGQKLSNMFWI